MNLGPHGSKSEQEYHDRLLDECSPEYYEERPVQNEDGTWDALDANGYGHSLGLASRAEVEIWLMGYEVGAEENK